MTDHRTSTVTLANAARNEGAIVIYRPPHVSSSEAGEPGQVVRVTDFHVMVRFKVGQAAKACPAESLTYQTPIAGGALYRVCPNCNAMPGEPCTQPTNESRRAVRWFHFAREDAYT